MRTFSYSLATGTAADPAGDEGPASCAAERNPDPPAVTEERYGSEEQTAGQFPRASASDLGIAKKKKKRLELHVSYFTTDKHGH